MANTGDILYGQELSASPNTVAWDDIPTRSDVVNLSGSIDRMLTLTRPVSSTDITTGDVVVLNPNGTVTLAGKIPDTIGDEVTLDTSTGSSSQWGSVYIPADDVFVVYWVNADFKSVVVSLSGSDDVVVGVINTASVGVQQLYGDICYYESEDKVLVVYTDYVSSQWRVYARVGDVILDGGDPTNHQLSFGSSTLLVAIGPSPNIYGLSLDYHTADDIAIMGRIYSTHYYIYPISVTGTTPTLGTAVNISAGGDQNPRMLYDSTNEKMITAYSDGGVVYASLITPVLTAGAAADYYVEYETPHQLSTGISVSSISIAHDVSNNRIVVGYGWTNNLGTFYNIGQVTGVATTSWSSMSSNVYNKKVNVQAMSYEPTLEKVVFFVYDLGSPYGLYSLVGDVDPDTDTINFWPAISVKSGQMINRPTKIPYTTVDDKFLLDLKDSSQNLLASFYTVNGGTIEVGGANVLGIAQNNANIGQDCIVGRYGFLDQNQSGLTPGTWYYLDETGDLVTYDNLGASIGLSITSTDLIVKV